MKRLKSKFLTSVTTLLMIIGCDKKEVYMNEIEIQFDKGVMLFTHHSKYFNGLVIERFDNNQIKLKIEVIDGLKSGNVIQYYQGGVIQTISKQNVYILFIYQYILTAFLSKLTGKTVIT